ncbi:thymidylate synthase [Streptomyces phage BRock]|uniref:Thymidylate synthase n=1 Tax=Streptomyces phage BRock TaxID=1913591 RepID=A0A1J0GVX7_9CAUD|nr:thymidylate synthase [Streptomyces phage BRock]APC46326.1 thymidylate synthase [Streptomyces phage BRock]
MKVTLLASTDFYQIPDSVMGTAFEDFYLLSPDALMNDADTLCHFAGRSCYQAWDMPNEKTRTNSGYMNNIINQGHFSVLEHATATFYIEGVSRNLTHELIRHRHLSYSELSQRYIDMENAQQVIPPAMGGGMKPLAGAIKATYRLTVDSLLGLGKKRKQAREAARYDLPGGTETRIVVTGNMRAWRDMLYKRYSVHADAEIQELAKELLNQLKLIAPACFQDFPEEPFE